LHSRLRIQQATAAARAQVRALVVIALFGSVSV
jgi:hypothetical protein